MSSEMITVDGMLPDAASIVSNASDVAKLLTTILREQALVVNIQGREHVLVEGWTLLAGMMGHSVGTTNTRPIEVDGNAGFIAHAEVYDRNGNVVGAADGICTRGERSWAKRDDYALSGMAQTRAISRAARQRFGFIVRLAGYEPTPAEEMGYAASDDEYSIESLVDMSRKGVPVEKIKSEVAKHGADRAADLTKNQLQEVIDSLREEFAGEIVE
jgi:hypothetical protein